MSSAIEVRLERHRRRCGVASSSSGPSDPGVPVTPPICGPEPTRIRLTAVDVDEVVAEKNGISTCKPTGRCRAPHRPGNAQMTNEGSEGVHQENVGRLAGRDSILRLSWPQARSLKLVLDSSPITERLECRCEPTVWADQQERMDLLSTQDILEGQQPDYV